MSDRIFLRLGENGALGADDLQWILYRSTTGTGIRYEEAKWHAVSFVRSTRAIIERCIREKGIKLSPEGASRLSQLPATFDEWKAQAA